MGTNSAAIKNNSIAIGHAAIAGGHTKADIDALDAKKMLLEADKANADKRLKEKTDAAEANPTAENKFQLSAAKAAVERLDLAIRRIDADLLRLSSVTTRNARNAIAIGNQAKATDESALAFGDTANAIGKASIAQGKHTQATAENAIAVGTSSNVSGANSVALGANITKLTTENSVVLGANSTEVVGKTGASHAVETVNNATVRTIAGPNFTYSGFVGKPADAGHYVSIGQAGKERQIKNLAAGAVTPTSTDAINGSQLYALMDRVENKQEPVVYTNKDGDKLVKVGNDFYKTEDLDPKTGKPLEGKNPVPAGDVIASMNNAGNNTTTPMALANIAGNLPGAKNGSTAPTTSGTLPEGADAPKTSNAATVGDVLNAGWNLQNNGEAKDFVKPYDTVNFIDGEGTKAVVDTKDNKVSTVKFDVKLGTGLKKDDQGNITVDTGNITNENGAPKVEDADKGKVATAGNVADAINNSYWTASATKGDDKIGTDDNIKPGNTVTFDAGKNIEIDHSTPNKFTFKTVDNPEFTGVDLKDKDGNKVNLAPTADGLKLGKGDNNEPANITNVTSGLKPYAETTPDSPDAKKGLVDLSKPKDGSAPTVSDNTAATVGDLRNMGWVVSADKTTGDLGNPYSEAVKNANEVKFVGTGSATVSGKTDENGVRTITVDVNEQAVANNAVAPVVYTDENGDRVYPTGKKDDKGNPIFSKNPDGSGDPVTGPVKTSINGPEGTKSPTTLDNVAGNLPGAKKDTEAPTTTGVGPTEEDAKKIANNAATVGDVLNAGWNLQGNGKDVDFVKPYDTVNFVDGEGTTAVVETKDNKVSTVKYNVNLGAGLEKGPDNKINIKTNGDTITVGDDGGLKVNTGSITVNNEDGKDADGNDVKAGTVSVPNADQNKVATVGDVANAINNVGWKATSGQDGSGIVNGTTTPLVKAGNTVTYRAGNNLILDQADKTFTYSLNPTLTGLTSAEFKDKDGNVNKIDANGMTITPADKDKQPVSLTNNGLDNGNNRITNVAPGVKDTDAVNVSQLRNAVGNLNKLQGQINKLGNRMNAGMATSAAMANLLQPHKPGQSVATAGIGQHKNQSAVAVGYSRISDNGKYGVRFSMGANTQGEVTGGAAVGYFW
nr:YadA-like family protein [Haemophilus haemolyticus]